MEEGKHYIKHHVQTRIPVTLDGYLLVLEDDMADHSVQEV